MPLQFRELFRAPAAVGAFLAFAGLAHAFEDCPSLNGAQPFASVIMVEPPGTWVLRLDDNRTAPIRPYCSVASGAILRTARMAPRASDSRIQVKLLTKEPQLFDQPCRSDQNCQVLLPKGGTVSQLLLALAAILGQQPAVAKSAITRLDANLRDSILWPADGRIDLSPVFPATPSGDYSLEFEKRDPNNIEVPSAPVRLKWKAGSGGIPIETDNSALKAVFAPGLCLFRANSGGFTGMAWLLIAPSAEVGRRLSDEREDLKHDWPAGSESAEKAFLLAHLIDAAQNLSAGVSR